MITDKYLMLALFVFYGNVGGDICWGQSTFTFSNYEPPAGIDAPVFDAFGNRLAGNNYVAVLYGGPTGDSLQLATAELGTASMSPVIFLDGQFAGYFARGGWVEIRNVPRGGSAWLQVRAWDVRLGTTYEDAAALGTGGYGESGLFRAMGGGEGGGVPSPPGPLVGLQSFSLRPIAEPSRSAAFFARPAVAALVLLSKKVNTDSTITHQWQPKPQGKRSGIIKTYFHVYALIQP